MIVGASIVLRPASALFVAAGIAGGAVAQDVTPTQLCERYWGTPEVHGKLRFDCACVGRYLESIKADIVDVEVHLRTFASVYTGKVHEDAEALRSKYGTERYQAALERSRGFLSGMMKDGGCRPS